MLIVLVSVVPALAIETIELNFDDILKGTTIEIPDYGDLAAVQFGYYDDYFRIVHDWGGGTRIESKTTEKYAILWFSILNTRNENSYFIDDIYDVVVTYDNKYQYNGWKMQCDPAFGDPSWGLTENRWYSLAPLYEGSFLVACELPNVAVSGEKPLKMEFKLKGVQFIYNIRL